jgi:hypothetical protein
VSGTTARAQRALDAAITVARAHGVRVDEPEVLSDRQNVVVRLGPAPVVARVASMTTLIRPDSARTFGREVALAGALVAAGAPVVPPSEELPPGPHVHDGTTLSFWRHVDIDPLEPTPADVGRAFGELHAALAGVPDHLLLPGRPLDTPLDDLAAFVDRAAGLGADPAQVDRLPDLLEALEPRLAGEPTSLHGDTHPGNLLATAAGWTWTDLEDCSRGPLGWDLACLRLTRRMDGRAAVDATPFPLSDDELAPFLWLRALHVGAWWHVVAAREREHLPEARDRLAAAVELVGRGLGSADQQ